MRMSRSIRLVAAAGLAGSVFSFSVAMADVAVPGGNLALEQLQAQHPGVTTWEHAGRIMTIFGAPMTQAATDGEAIAQFVGLHAEAFGAGTLELDLQQVHALQSRNKTVYVFSQKMDGLPVEFGRLTVVSHNELGVGEAGENVSTVVMASAKLAQRPAGGFAADAFTSEQAMARVRAIPRFAGLDTWGAAEMVVFFGEGDFSEWITPVRAWKFTGEKTVVDGDPQKQTFFVDAATNEVIHVRNEILHIDITGNVQGWVSPNNTADHAGNPPALRNMSEVLVRVQGQPNTTVRTDRNGNFTIPWPGTTPVTLEVGTNFAPTNGVAQVQVTDSTGPSDVYTVSATPGTPVNIQMNPSSGRTEVTTAEVNALHYLTVTRNYLQDLVSPSFATQLDTFGNVTGGTPGILPANVQVAGTCNAFYNGTSTNYYPVGGSCNNTAFASVISHEYGHHVVNRRGLAQGAFGEGYSDTLSILIYDDAVVGRFFQTNGGAVRTPDTANINYPCGSTAIHTCGMILGDFIIELRRALGNRYGSAQGLTVARELHADWTQITGGGIDLNSAHPQTIVEMLTVDDNDAIFCNGSPNRDQIVAAANIKQIPVPGIEGRLSVAPLASNPTSRLIGEPITVGALVSNGSATLTPGSARLRYRHSDSNTFYTVSMTQTAPGQFSGTIPAGNCGQRVEYSFVFGSSAGDVTLPNACTGGTVYTVDIVNPNPVSAPFFTDTFETANAGWTTGGTATTGQWVRGDPVGTTAQPESGTVGVNCWFTGQGTAGGALGEADVDGGTVILTSPTFNLTGQGGFVVARYDRWYSNGTGGAPYTDVFRVEVSNDGGTTWRPGETVGPASSPDTNPGWRAGGVVLASSGQPTNQVRIRFIADDAGTGSLVEAAIDNLRFASQPCGCNDIDFNNDGSVFDPIDIDDFLNVFSEGPCSTGNCDSIDFNNDGSVFNPDDIDSFLSVFSEGPCTL
jgi:hypothetical protein